MKKNFGFTLIELMVTTAVLIGVVFLAVPSMTSFFEGNAIKNVWPTFQRSIAYARSEAAQRNQVIEISPISAGFVNGDSDWSEGWNLNAVVAPGIVELVRRVESIPGDTIFTSDTFSQVTPIRIQPSGQAELIGDFTLRLLDCTGREQLILTLMLSGTLDRREIACP